MTPPNQPPRPGNVATRVDPHPTPDNLVPLRRKESTEVAQFPGGADPSALAAVVGKVVASQEALKTSYEKHAAEVVGAIGTLATEQGKHTEALLVMTARIGDLADAIGKPGDPSVFARATLRDMTPTEIEAAETGSGLWGEIGRGKIRDYQMMRLVASEAADEAAEKAAQKAKPNARKAAAWATAIGTGIGAVVSNLPWDKWF